MQQHCRRLLGLSLLVLLLTASVNVKCLSLSVIAFATLQSKCVMSKDEDLSKLAS